MKKAILVGPPTVTTKFELYIPPLSRGIKMRGTDDVPAMDHSTGIFAPTALPTVSYSSNLVFSAKV